MAETENKYDGLGNAVDKIEDLSSVTGGSYILTKYNNEEKTISGTLLRKTVILDSDENPVLNLNLSYLDISFLVCVFSRYLLADALTMKGAGGITWTGDDEVRQSISDYIVESQSNTKEAHKILSDMGFAPAKVVP